ncbi:hypothetical protein NL676_022331 [Syzygium grande]|nr:hypothetical protein NL676_022331 [Syzygium grande]
MGGEYSSSRHHVSSTNTNLTNPHRNPRPNPVEAANAMDQIRVFDTNLETPLTCLSSLSITKVNPHSPLLLLTLFLGRSSSSSLTPRPPLHDTTYLTTPFTGHASSISHNNKADPQVQKSP